MDDTTKKMPMTTTVRSRSLYSLENILSLYRCLRAAS